MIKSRLMLIVVLYNSLVMGMEKSESVSAVIESSKTEATKTIVKLLPFICTIKQGNLRNICGIRYETQGQLNRHLRESHGIAIAKKRKNAPRDCPGV